MTRCPFWAVAGSTPALPAILSGTPGEPLTDRSRHAQMRRVFSEGRGKGSQLALKAIPAYGLIVRFDYSPLSR